MTFIGQSLCFSFESKFSQYISKVHFECSSWDYFLTDHFFSESTWLLALLCCRHNLCTFFFFMKSYLQLTKIQILHLYSSSTVIFYRVFVHFEYSNVDDSMNGSDQDNLVYDTRFGPSFSLAVVYLLTGYFAKFLVFSAVSMNMKVESIIRKAFWAAPKLQSQKIR